MIKKLQRHRKKNHGAVTTEKKKTVLKIQEASFLPRRNGIRKKEIPQSIRVLMKYNV